MLFILSHFKTTSQRGNELRFICIFVFRKENRYKIRTPDLVYSSLCNCRSCEHRRTLKGYPLVAPRHNKGTICLQSRFVKITWHSPSWMTQKKNKRDGESDESERGGQNSHRVSRPFSKQKTDRNSGKRGPPLPCDHDKDNLADISCIYYLNASHLDLSDELAPVMLFKGVCYKNVP